MDLVAIIAGTAIFLVLLAWKILGVGRGLQAAVHEKDRADAFETEMERIGRANAARADAERNARNGMFDDKWARPD